jgi:alpha-tubulin suppressor-like RCC1 family protein
VDRKICDDPPDSDDDIDSRVTLRLMLTCLDSGISVKTVSCGNEHSLFLTRHGTVLSCGSGRYAYFENRSLG